MIVAPGIPVPVNLVAVEGTVSIFIVLCARKGVSTTGVSGLTFTGTSTILDEPFNIFVPEPEPGKVTFTR